MNEQQAFDACLRTSLAAFIRKSFQTLLPGEPYLPNWHIYAFAWHLEQCLKGDIKRLIVNMPPRHLKSIMLVAFNAWVLGKDPTRKIISVSYSQSLSLKHASDCRKLMEADWYKRVFPNTILIRSTENELTTSMNGFRFTTSVGGTLTGRGGNIFILDDPITPQEAYSEAEREQVKRWYDGTLYSRQNNKNEDVVILTMQRLHQEDLVGHVQEKENWTILNIPAIAETDQQYQIRDSRFHQRKIGDVLHAERESLETLEVIQQNLGSYVFSAQYQQSPVRVDGNLFRWSWFKHHEEPLKQLVFDKIIQSWDTATETGTHNDFSVCTTWGLKGELCYLIDIFRERLEFTELRKAVYAQYKKHRPSLVLVEYAGSGIQLVQQINTEGKIRLKGIRPKGDKVQRAYGQTPLVELGLLWLPEDAPWLEDFKKEILAFPHGRHDDQVDSMVYFLMWLEKQRRNNRPIERPNPTRRDLGPRPILGSRKHTRTNLIPSSDRAQWIDHVLNRRNIF